MISRRIVLFSTLVVSLCAPAAIAQNGGPDAPQDIPGWGRFIDPKHDCEYNLDKDKGVLTISVPAGEHDLSAELNVMNAPHVFQQVTGDFTLQVHVSGIFQPVGQAVQGRPPYEGAGLLAGVDTRNCIRLERACFEQLGTRKRLHYVNFEIRVNGQVEALGNAGEFPLAEDGEAYLRLVRRGDRFWGSASRDGRQWRALGSKTLAAPQKLFAGVAAINASQTAFAPDYSGFKLEQDMGGQN